jgi:hypothetical protein
MRSRQCVTVLKYENGWLSNMRSDERTTVEMLREKTEKRQKSIVAKCHPAIFELAELYKESVKAREALGANRPPELIAEINARMEKGLETIHKKYPGPIRRAPNRFAAQIIFSREALTPKSNVPDEQKNAEAMHWTRHHIPWKVDIERAAARDYGASKRILRTIGELVQLSCGKGPIQPFKGNPYHSEMLTIVWGLGIEKLTPEELAIFFDSFCPCGSEHDPDALKKQRARFQKSLVAASAA